MSAGIAHEINNPLAVIGAKTTMIKRRITKGDFNPETLLTDLSKIDATVDRISKIIKGLKSFSRSDDQEPFEVADPHLIIDDVMGLCQDRMKNRGVRLEIIKNSTGMIQCRQHQIAQVILNLLNNGADAIEGQTDPWIKIELQNQKDQIEISVTDCGLGIPPAVVKKMMQPFFTTKEVGKGTGLGLSISKGIIETHNGQLVYDGKSANTRFVITLPVASSDIQTPPKAS